MKGWEKIFHANRDQKTAGVAILVSDEIDFKTKAVKRDKEGHYIMIKGPKTILYISVSFAVSYTGLSLPSF